MDAPFLLLKGDVCKRRTFFVVVVRTTLYTCFVKKCFNDTIYLSKFVVFLFLLLFTIFCIRIRDPRVSGPSFTDIPFASQFFELFTLPARTPRLNALRMSTKFNTRSAFYLRSSI